MHSPAGGVATDRHEHAHRVSTQGVTSMTARRPYLRFLPALTRVLGIVFIGATIAPIAEAALPSGNPVQQWNQIAEDTVVASGAFQNEGLIYMAYAAAAVYDAVTAIEGEYEPYAIRVPASPSASAAAALALITDGPARIAAGREVGVAAANAIIELRSGDGRLTPIGVTSPVDAHQPGPGVWRLTPPFTPTLPVPQTPWVGDVQPFVLREPGQFHPA